MSDNRIQTTDAGVRTDEPAPPTTPVVPGDQPDVTPAPDARPDQDDDDDQGEGDSNDEQ